MHISEAGIDLIKRSESLCLDSYTCPAGIPTIGYGHTRGVHPGMRISPQMADALLREDIEETECELALAVHAPVTQGQWDALVSFAFNCKGWRDATLIRKVNAGDYAGAADELLRWNHVGGKVLNGLTARRAAERELFNS